ncbi:BnaC02g24030D [Brassica napus]|uniref:BnaC02g24030D protein n=1 Tax=Brassica napus TaxID=3708 RepID=A0A078G711_BRANA|nr:BnaC02g24030D [Brassica napus]
MESGQLPEPEPPEPPDLPSSPARASLSKISSVTVEIFISSSPFYFVGVSISNRPFTSEEVSIVSFHLPALAPSTESFLNLDLDLRFFQVPVYFDSRILRPSISSMTLTSWIMELGSSHSISEAGLLVFGIGSFIDLFTAVCSLITGFSPVRYTDVMSSPCQCVDWASIRSYSILSLPSPLTLVFRVTLELRNMGLFGDVLMDIAYVVSTFVDFGGPYVVSLKEKFIGILSRMNMIMVGINYPFVSLLEQSLFPIFPHVWSELDEQALLVLQGCSSQRMLSAYGAVCVVLWVTLDAIFQNVYETVMMQFHMVFFVICIAILSFTLPVFGLFGSVQSCCILF